MRALAIGLSLLLAAILALLGVFVARNKCRRDSLLRTQIAHPDVPVNLPHIHPNLWLGNVASARAADDLGFDHVVCVAYGDTCRASALGASRTYVDDTFPDSMGVPQEDFAGRVDRAADAIHAALEKGGRVLVHCHAGINRSVSSIVAYASKHRHIDAARSIPYIRSRNHVHRRLPALSNSLFEAHCRRLFGSRE